MTDHYTDLLDRAAHDDTEQADDDQQAADWAGQEEDR